MQKYSQNQINKMAYMLSDKVLRLIILPTERCNFRCTYCYEDYCSGRMSNETVEAIKKLILMRSQDEGFGLLSLSWFGGEPLLAKDIVLDISNYARRLSEGRFKYSGVMTTNGYQLNGETFSELHEAGVRFYQISLDGPKFIHDQTRIRSDGQGTFDTIWKNLLDIKQSAKLCSVVLRLHVTKNNLAFLPDFIDQLKRSFGSSDQFSLFFKAVENLGGENGKLVNTFSNHQEKQDHIQRLCRLASDGFRVSQLDCERDTGDCPACYASAPNSLVIRSDGSLAKCTVDFYSDKNRIGCLKPDGTVFIDQEKLAYWIRGIRHYDARVLSCPLHE